MFDKILGGALGDLAKLDDNTVKFEKMIAKLKTLIDPVVSAVGPLEVFGTLPILGDLSDLAGLAMKNQKPTEMSEDQIR